jgi:hypothetical protein
MQINRLGVVFAIVAGMAVDLPSTRRTFLELTGRGLRTILLSDPEQPGRGI